MKSNSDRENCIKKIEKNIDMGYNKEVVNCGIQESSISDDFPHNLKIIRIFHWLVQMRFSVLDVDCFVLFYVLTMPYTSYIHSYSTANATLTLCKII